MVSVTIAVDGLDRAAIRAPVSAPSWAATMESMTSKLSPSAPRSMRVNSPSWAASSVAAVALRPVKAAIPQPSPALAVYQAWWARWKAPSPMCTILASAAGAGWVARFSSRMATVSMLTA